MELAQLQNFVRVVDTGGLTQAALQLNVTQPTLSRQIAQLEAELGQRLLVRTGRGVTPTEAGASLLRNAREILALASRARDEIAEMQASPSGRIAVGMPPRVAGALAVPLVEKFRERFPKAVITVAEGLSHHLRELLSAGRLDLALLFDPLPSPHLSYAPLASENLVLVMPPAYPRKAESVRLKQLADWPLVLPSSPHAIRLLLDSAAHDQGFSLNVIAEVDAVRSVRMLVMRGVGCSVLPEAAVDREMADMGVKVMQITHPGIRNKLVLASSNHGPLTRLARGTTQILRDLREQALGRNLGDRKAATARKG